MGADLCVTRSWNLSPQNLQVPEIRVPLILDNGRPCPRSDNYGSGTDTWGQVTPLVAIKKWFPNVSGPEFSKAFMTQHTCLSSLEGAQKPSLPICMVMCNFNGQSHTSWMMSPFPEG